jgi:hypothetical protein
MGYGFQHFALGRVRHGTPQKILLPVAAGGGEGSAVLSRIRLDKLLLERALAPTRERAQAMVLAGRVLVNQQ